MIIFLVHLWHSLFLFIGISLVVISPRLKRFLFSLELAWWKLCVQVVYQIYLCCLGVTCHLLNILGCGFRAFHLFVSCLALLAGNLYRSMLLSFIVFETNSSSLRKNQKISLCRILAVSCVYLANATWVCTALYHSSTDLSPCKKLVSQPSLALTSLDWACKTPQIFPRGHQG